MQVWFLQNQLYTDRAIEQVRGGVISYFFEYERISIMSSHL